MVDVDSDVIEIGGCRLHRAHFAESLILANIILGLLYLIIVIHRLYEMDTETRSAALAIVLAQILRDLLIRSVCPWGFASLTISI